jgi:hypothetical protein
MMLPLSHEYPFTLHKNETLNFVVEISQPGFVEALVRKCDKSSPSFAYTERYANFMKGEFDS